MTLLLSAFFAALALLLDYRLAEPKRFHPLVCFGNWANALQQRLNPKVSALFPATLRRSTTLQFIFGVIALLIAVGPLFYFFWAALRLLHVYSHWLAALVEIILLYVCIGGRSLQQHVLAVKQALDQHDLMTARQKLSWIVSRETTQLSEQQVAQANIETTLENSSDAIFASLFWFAIGGAPLVLLHRWLNTLDAMWGYKNPQFLYFGRAAARLDDVMNYIPARLTAMCFCLLSPWLWLVDKRRNAAWYCWQTQAEQCSSPNAGPVMTAGAGALNCRLSDGAFYHGEWQQKPPMGCGDAADVKDIQPALTLVTRAIVLYMSLWLLAGLLLVFIEGGYV
jgi:adenosylcobinamide-phosphate synthase